MRRGLKLLYCSPFFSRFGLTLCFLYLLPNSAIVACWRGVSVISGTDSAPGRSSSLPFRSHIVRNRLCYTAIANCLFAFYLSIYTLVALVSYIDQNAIILSVEHAFSIVTNQNLTYSPSLAVFFSFPLSAHLSFDLLPLFSPRCPARCFLMSKRRKLQPRSLMKRRKTADNRLQMTTWMTIKSINSLDLKLS